MSGVVLGCALAVAATCGATGLYGAFCWYRGRTSHGFWIAVRAGQALAGALAVVAGVAYAAGRRPAQDLFYLYALLPVAIGFVAEQLRALSAAQVLENRALADGEAVGRLPAAEQQAVVVAILRRELGIMAAAALVVCFLALRAAMTY